MTVAFGSGWGQGEGLGWASHALEAPTAVGPLPLTAPSFLALQACPRSTARKSGHYPPEHGTSGIQKHVARSPSSLRPPGAGGGQGAQPARVQLCSPALGNRPGGRLLPRLLTSSGAWLVGSDDLQAQGPAWTRRAWTEKGPTEGCTARGTASLGREWRTCLEGLGGACPG